MRIPSTRQWLRATWLGWILGVLITILAALAGDAVGISGSQTPVGVGMGAGVGIMQARALRKIISGAGAWVWSSVVGLAAPFLVFDVSRAAGFELPYSLYVSVAVGGLAAGLWQAMLLRPAAGNAWMWAVGSTAGWSLAAASAVVADRLPRALSLRGLAGAGTYLAVVLAGGLVLGLVTAVAFVRLDRREMDAPESRSARA